ncbi:specific RNA polymerase II transcription factor [Cryptococcus wingfieldii CBS 7118]|uniref:Specific RNA polymerase II transcription factor n=1 Tax=Cryptococcus wingfieldii CBS 7118 TaxID=1295528 RepID=A0A1E3J1R3_9TREE|nr:specific RNA polymerase II transcription factor [Cryptococcus wingfieldii CBS 7118]ODN94768.1 specific RNA polymerase II transcription factor [Cryptococcus wingfieldii CBS 7118]
MRRDDKRRRIKKSDALEDSMLRDESERVHELDLNSQTANQSQPGQYQPQAAYQRYDPANASNNTSNGNQHPNELYPPAAFSYSGLHPTPQNNIDTTPGSIISNATSASSAISPNGTRTKRRRIDPESRTIVNASLSNEMDALEILASAATDGNENRGQGSNGVKKVSWGVEEKEKTPMRELSAFPLIKAGIIDEAGLHEMVQLFFQHYHPTLPIFQTARIPRTRAQLDALAANETFLLTCIIAVASRHPPSPTYAHVHDQTWSILRDALADYSFAGLQASVGFVEGVLLLAEYLPKEGVRPAGEVSMEMFGGGGRGQEAGGIHGSDNRRSWALIGVAIRAAYLLGLDQIALEIDELRRTPDVERARSVWTWCYLYDRTIDETGLAFWSRGPSLCFVGYSHVSQTGQAAARLNFPYQLSQSSGSSTDDQQHDDSASLMQSMVELTQVMTNAHGILYPSRLRTETLVRQGEYFLFLDSFKRALDSYKIVWQPKKWSNPVLEELSWMTFHFVRQVLYISSFGYSAHIKRAQWRAEEDAAAGRERQPVQLFPRGTAASPDALYIYDSISAANEVLHIALRLGQMDALRYLPSRYLINISYAAVFALKSNYTETGEGKENTFKTRELVDEVCHELGVSCSDKDHLAVRLLRYGHMLRMLSKKLEQVHEAVSTAPSRMPSPEPPVTARHAQINVNAIPQEQGRPWPEPQPQTSTSDIPAALTPASFQLPPFPDMSFIHPGANVYNPENPQQQVSMFDYGDMGQFDIDLKGFWDEFNLGEGGGFPFN